MLNGVNRLSAASTVDLHDGTLHIINAAGLNAQTFASLTLSDNSVPQLDSSTLTFNNLGTVASSKTLTYRVFIKLHHQIRLSGCREITHAILIS